MNCDYCGNPDKECHDKYGNEIDGDFINCSFPDCGCDGARLCMAKNGASEAACKGNIEGMWLLNTPEAKKARGDLMASLGKELKS